MEIPLSAFQILVEGLCQTESLPNAEERFGALSHIDPFPDVPHALLHAGHLASYLVTAGVIDPFEVSSLEKPATYLVPLEGDVRYVDVEGQTQSFYLSDSPVPGRTDVQSYFDLHPNSLCYVTLKPTFRMPSYLAGRFNLLIRDVYRGLLVGTGPLVDPGFVGQLHIPLHNFTSTKYRFHAGEGFVYFEFTKLSWKNQPNTIMPSWLPKLIEHQPPFPRSKNRRKTLDDYISQATGGGPPRNELLIQLKNITTVAEDARRRLNIISLSAGAALATIVLTVLGVVVAAWQLFLGAQQFTQSSSNDLNNSIEKLKNRIEVLEQLEKSSKSTVVPIPKNDAPSKGSP